MVLQDLVKINEAEDKATAIIDNAKLTGKQMVKSTMDEMSKKLSEATIEAKKEFTAIVDDIVSSGQKEIDDIMDAGQLEVEGINKLPDTEIDKAVNLVMKKVVGNNGNN